MSVLVTGGVGFVGIHVVRVLARAGRPVVALDLNAPDPVALRFLGDAAETVSFVRADVRDRERLRLALEEHRVEVVVHAAAVTATRPEVERQRSAETVEVNVLGAVAALEAARARPVRRLVHVSSGSIYGHTNPRILLPETAPANPAGLYPITQWAGEQVARRYSEIHDIPVAVVRLTLPFGPMERDTGARSLLSPFPSWFRAAAADEELVVPSLEVGRDFTYVEDIARGIVAVLDAPRLSFETYNIGNGVRCTVMQVLDALREHFPRLRYRVSPEDEGIQESLGPRTERGPLDPGRLFQDCGYRPSYDLEAGLAAYAAWLRGEGMMA